MAILIDLNQVLISSIVVQKTGLEEDLVRHILLNALRSNIKKFKDYGEVILCCDSKSYWRKKAFPYYKSHRKEARDKSSLDWNLIFKCINQLKQDLKENFPYKLIEVQEAEADDIIGTLVPKLSAHEKVVIISSDADFKQLQKYPNVKQYNPILNVFVTSKNPSKELKEKIIRGDKGDGIPSILSDDDTFVIKKRQPPISSKKLQLWLDQEPKSFCESEQIYRNFSRNSLLIDFSNIPIEIREGILLEYETVQPNAKNKVYKYFVTNRLMNLLECIEDFL